jgi:hypothetical protein
VLSLSRPHCSLIIQNFLFSFLFLSLADTTALLDPARQVYFLARRCRVLELSANRARTARWKKAITLIKTQCHEQKFDP